MYDHMKYIVRLCSKIPLESNNLHLLWKKMNADLVHALIHCTIS